MKVTVACDACGRSEETRRRCRKCKRAICPRCRLIDRDKLTLSYLCSDCWVNGAPIVDRHAEPAGEE